MAGHDSGSILVFAQFQSAVDEGFWHRLSSLKLNKLGIDESPIPITGTARSSSLYVLLICLCVFVALISIQILESCFLCWCCG